MAKVFKMVEKKLTKPPKRKSLTCISFIINLNLEIHIFIFFFFLLILNETVQPFDTIQFFLLSVSCGIELILMVSKLVNKRYHTIRDHPSRYRLTRYRLSNAGWVRCVEF